MVVDPVRGRMIAGQGREARVVAPDQNAGILDVSGEKSGVVEPTDARLGGCPCFQRTPIHAVHGDDAGTRNGVSQGRC